MTRYEREHGGTDDRPRYVPRPCPAMVYTRVVRLPADPARRRRILEGLGLRTPYIR